MPMQKAARNKEAEWRMYYKFFYYNVTILGPPEKEFNAQNWGFHPIWDFDKKNSSYKISEA